MDEKTTSVSDINAFSEGGCSGWRVGDVFLHVFSRLEQQQLINTPCTAIDKEREEVFVCKRA